MTLEAASTKDEPWIRELLTLCGLPQEDLTPQHFCHFFVMKERERVIGVIGLEVLGQLALLRSLAVGPQYRNRGYASQLIRKAEGYAASLQIVGLYLLTMTEERESFFTKRGYRKIGRNSPHRRFRGRLNSRASALPAPCVWSKNLEGIKYEEITILLWIPMLSRE